LSLTGCDTDKVSRVPIKEGWKQPLRTPVTYIVEKGDSLYSIAWLYGLDYRQIAKDNHLVPPAYKIQAGQKLRLRPQQTKNKNVSAAPVKTTGKPPVVTESATNAMTSSSKVDAEKIAQIAAPTPSSGSTAKVSGIVWAWPAQGKIVSTFNPDDLNRGIDIAGKLGQPVVAAASGKVVYAGSGLRGYGQLIILKHNDNFLSAYAHNQKLLVKEGQTVKMGQTIANLGDTEAKSPMLHFEIRQNGKPVDPLKFLPTR